MVISEKKTEVSADWEYWKVNSQGLPRKIETLKSTYQICQAMLKSKQIIEEPNSKKKFHRRV